VGARGELSLIEPPNGLPLSCRERAAENDFKKAPISRAKRSATAACSAARSVLSGRHPHPRTTLSWNYAGTTGVRLGSRASGSTPGTTGLARNHAQHRTTRGTTSLDREPRASGITLLATRLPHNGPSYHAGTTGAQHNEPSSHTGTTGAQHNGPSYHTGTTGFGTPERAEQAFRKRNSLLPTKKGMTTALPRVPNGLAFSCRERAGRSRSKTNDLAREAVSCNAVLACRLAVDFHLRCAE